MKQHLKALALGVAILATFFSIASGFVWCFIKIFGDYTPFAFCGLVILMFAYMLGSELIG